MSTKITLFRHVIIRIDVKRIIRARLHARLACNTSLCIKVDDAVVKVVKGASRADIHAGRGLTVVAPQYRKEPFGCGVLTCFHILHPSSIHADWHLVLRFARHGASMATDALTVIYEKAEVHALSVRYGKSERWRIIVATQISNSHHSPLIKLHQ